MKTRAAILVAVGRPLELADLTLPDPGPGQVLVEVVHSGVCHTQVLECRGHREDKFLPHCLGHEAGGIVRGVGPGVTKVKPGDRAILSWIKGTAPTSSAGRTIGPAGRSTRARSRHSASTPS